MLIINFSDFPELETQRLKLRRADLNDVNELFALRSDPNIMKYIPRPVATSLEEATEHFKMMDEKISNNEMINWAITLKDNPKMIGTIGYFRMKPEHYRAKLAICCFLTFMEKVMLPKPLMGLSTMGLLKWDYILSRQ